MRLAAFHIDKTVSPLTQVDGKPILCARVMDDVDEPLRWRNRRRIGIVNCEVNSPNGFVARLPGGIHLLCEGRSFQDVFVIAIENDWLSEDVNRPFISGCIRAA